MRATTGIKQLEADVAKYHHKGVKLYTAEWNGDSRGYKLSDPECYRFLQAAQDLGIKNVHVHKGPTIWPLDKDAFDVSDVDHAATDFQGLNFIVEHVGLPRIEDFCFMAVQEPNVYAGLSVVIGGLMHARPKFFAKVIGELMFWVGEDKMLFGGDYNIWTPKWQVEGFVDWQMPDDDQFTDYAKLTTATKKKILGLNAAKLYDIPVPAGLELPTTAARTTRRVRSWWTTPRGRRRDVCGPQCGPRWGRCSTRSWTSPSRISTSSSRAPSPLTAWPRSVLRLPTFFCAPNFSFLMVADAYDAVSAVPG